MKTLLQGISGWRYKLGFYAWPYELKALQRVIVGWAAKRG